MPCALNDSGCLLGDKDLYDAGLDDDEESLDAIRAAVKQKSKKHKVRATFKSPICSSGVGVRSLKSKRMPKINHPG